MNSYFQNKKRLVIKIGSATLVENDEIRQSWLESLAADIVELVSKDVEVLIVTSGAIALGRKDLKVKKKKISLQEKSAAAAIGQIQLASGFRSIFKKFDLNVAQILLTLSDCNDRKSYLNLQNTLTTLLANGIISVINENDSVANDEIKIGDNDRLSARVAQMVSADLLILFSDIEGFYDKNPNIHDSANFIPEVEKITKEIEEMAGDSASAVGTGGMITKVKAAKMAALAGCETVITSGSENHCLKKLFNSKSIDKKNFTIFRSDKDSGKSRKKWLSGFLNATGEVIVNECAKEALTSKKISLLPVGVVAVKGNFKKGDAVFIKDESDNHIASGISNYDAKDATKILEKNSKEVKKIFGNLAKTELVHVDNLVILI